ncbi:hypothetical protein QCA50_003604 [Cerrena zonata]|uniref:Uncharacterized protein n=1 Tax=Cerrena zonata TaxID=2478898 RepID=A0AAW0GKZ9_9APHY
MQQITEISYICSLIVAAIIGAWFWDLVISVPETIRVYTHGCFKLPDVVYLLSRMTSGGLFITAFLYLVTENEDCQTMVTVACWFAAFTLPLNSMLFLFRIRGVFLESRFIPPFFSILWLSTCTSFIAPFASKAARLDSSAECLIQWVSTRNLTAFIAISFYDTLVFVCISYKLLSFTYAQGWKARVRSFFRGEQMGGQVSKALLQSGQLYYLLSVCGNLLVLIFFVLKGTPPSIKMVFLILNIALQNAMACRVFIYLKLGFIHSHSSPDISPIDISLPRFNTETNNGPVPFDSTTVLARGSFEAPSMSGDKFPMTNTETLPAASESLCYQSP